MIKNPTKKANARHLCAHLDMIEKTVEKKAISPTLLNSDLVTSTQKDRGSRFAVPETKRPDVEYEHHMEASVGDVTITSFCPQKPGSSHEESTRPASAASLPPLPVASAPTTIHQPGTSSDPQTLPHSNSARTLQPQCSDHPMPSHHNEAQHGPHYFHSPLPDGSSTFPLVGLHDSDSGSCDPCRESKSSSGTEDAATLPPSTLETPPSATQHHSATASPLPDTTQTASPHRPSSPNLPPDDDLPSRPPTSSTGYLVSVDGHGNNNTT